MDDPILKFMEEYFYHIWKKWKEKILSKFYPTLWAPHDINMISGYNSKNEKRWASLTHTPYGREA